MFLLIYSSNKYQDFVLTQTMLHVFAYNCLMCLYYVTTYLLIVWEITSEKTTWKIHSRLASCFHEHINVVNNLYSKLETNKLSQEHAVLSFQSQNPNLHPLNRFEQKPQNCTFLSISVAPTETEGTTHKLYCTCSSAHTTPNNDQSRQQTAHSSNIMTHPPSLLPFSSSMQPAYEWRTNLRHQFFKATTGKQFSSFRKTKCLTFTQGAL